MNTKILNEKVDCTECVHFEIEGVEGVCNHFSQVLEDYEYECLCSAFQKIEKKGE